MSRNNRSEVYNSDIERSSLPANINNYMDSEDAKDVGIVISDMSDGVDNWSYIQSSAVDSHLDILPITRDVIQLCNKSLYKMIPSFRLICAIHNEYPDLVTEK